MPRIIIIMLTWYVTLYYCGRIMDFFIPGRCVGRFHTIDVKIALTLMSDLIKLIRIHVVDDFFIM